MFLRVLPAAQSLAGRERVADDNLPETFIPHTIVTPVISVSGRNALTFHVMAAPTPALESALHNSSSGLKPAHLFDLRFNLTESEWKEASNLVHPIFGGAHTKPWARLFCGFCAGINLIAPTLNGTSWGELIRYAPGRAIFAGTAMLLCAGAAIWMKPLERRRNQLDVERHVVLSEHKVTVTLNERVWNNLWTDFMYFREGPNVAILRHSVLTFWTIPLRAIPIERQSEFRQLLNRKLARRQPYSWSPDSSSAPR